jgi:methanogenic corrinoid protein MtbC1
MRRETAIAASSHAARASVIAAAHAAAPGTPGTSGAGSTPAAGGIAGAGKAGTLGSMAGLARTIEHELVPRLLLAHRAGPFPPYERALVQHLHGAVCADDRHLFLESVLGTDEDAATRIVEAMVGRGVTIEAVYLDLLAPTAVALGELWDSDECDFIEVTIALGRLQRVLREVSGIFVATGSPETVAGRVLLSSMPGEQHTLGLFMVAEFLLRDGWGVQVGTPASSDELLALVRDEWFDVVGFSAACDTRLLRLRHEIANVRRNAQNPRLVVLVGGKVFVDNPELVERVGADGYATSAAEAPRCCRDLVERQPA